MAETEIVHRAPEPGSNLTACCKRVPFDLPIDDRLTVVGDITCPVPMRAYTEGFEEGLRHGYELAGADAVARVLAVRGDIATALDAYAKARWTHSSVDQWANVAHDLLGTVYAAVSGEDGDELADATVLGDVVAERARQDAKWGPPSDRMDGTGPQSRPLGLLDVTGDWLSHVGAEDLAETAKRSTDTASREGRLTWAHILLEEVFEAFAESDRGRLRAELVQVAAVAVKWARMIDARPAPAVEMRAAA
ncbi:hypothetical protein [Microbacterium allomyrinae]|uniref:Uncharacterized protein n=1 Tax=Microbacterium allomyrinae TaxID=2830666 RepID=A0A9X1LRV8_9MICO|nr:hypothetical protein [Microbacterium allomyrinae]MCC2030633.1 hypothetical protein [Microbacterium allomyrinae]